MGPADRREVSPLGARTFKPPPSPTLGGKGEGWAELASGLLLGESSSLLRDLEIEGIETRREVEASGVTIKVRKTSLEDARFVLARFAFSREATLKAPRAETGRRRWSRAAGVAAGFVGGLLVLGSALTLAPAEDDSGPRCPGRRDHLMAPRGGCLGVTTTDDR
jgi:hypothetical protein